MVSGNISKKRFRNEVETDDYPIIIVICQVPYFLHLTVPYYIFTVMLYVCSKTLKSTKFSESQFASFV